MERSKEEIQILQAISQYLLNKPYAEVFQLIDGLKYMGVIQVKGPETEEPDPVEKESKKK